MGTGTILNPGDKAVDMTRDGMEKVGQLTPGLAKQRPSFSLSSSQVLLQAFFTVDTEQWENSCFEQKVKANWLHIVGKLYKCCSHNIAGIFTPSFRPRRLSS